MKLYLLSFAVIFSQILFSQKKLNDGKDVVTAMYKKYEGCKWYQHLTFIQDIVFYKDGKEEKKEVWHEASSSPGNLIIKFDSINSKSGVVFSNGKVCSIKDGKSTEPKPFIHDLTLVGFDVYFLKPERSAHLLDSLGYNLKIMREDTFEGRKIYVVGAQKGDIESNQFWIDAERMYMHKIIYKRRGKTQDCVFADYTLMEKKWVAKKVIFKTNGVLEAVETYYNIKLPKTLSPDIFKPEKFSEAKW